MRVTPLAKPALDVQASDDAICAGEAVQFTATASNGGIMPQYTWKKNGSIVGGNASTYADDKLVNGDVIVCRLTSSIACPTMSEVESGSVRITVFTEPVM